MKLRNKRIQELEDDNPTHLPLLLVELKRLNENKTSNYKKILDLGQKIVRVGESFEILQYLGARNDEIKANTVLDGLRQLFQAGRNKMVCLKIQRGDQPDTTSPRCWTVFSI